MPSKRDKSQEKPDDSFPIYRPSISITPLHTLTTYQMPFNYSPEMVQIHKNHSIKLKSRLILEIIGRGRFFPCILRSITFHFDLIFLFTHIHVNLVFDEFFFLLSVPIFPQACIWTDARSMSWQKKWLSTELRLKSIIRWWTICYNSTELECGVP